MPKMVLIIIVIVNKFDCVVFFGKLDTNVPSSKHISADLVVPLVFLLIVLLVLLF